MASQENGLVRILLLCGMVSPLLYVAMVVFIPLRWDRYRSAAQTVSELSAIGAPTRSLCPPGDRWHRGRARLDALPETVERSQACGVFEGLHKSGIIPGTRGSRRRPAAMKGGMRFTVKNGIGNFDDDASGVGAL